MSPAARQALRSTLGGRSVALAAAGIEAASLRTLPLVGTPRLLALADPLAALLAGPPELDQLGDRVDLALGERTAAPASPRLPTARQRVASAAPSVGTPAGAPAANGVRRLGVVAAGRTTKAAITGATTAPTAPGSTTRGAPGAGNSAAPASIRPSHDVRVGDVTSTGAPHRIDTGPAATEPLPEAPLEAPRVEIDVAALARAARTDVTSSETPGVTAPSRAATDGTSPTGAPRTAPRQSPQAERGRSPAPQHQPGSPGATAPDPVGALGELLSRWDNTPPARPQSDAHATSPYAGSSPSAGPPDPAPAPGAQPVAPRSPFAPLTDRLADHAREAGQTGQVWGPLADEPLDLDTVQLALDVLLRREVEQHGLEGGLR